MCSWTTGLSHLDPLQENAAKSTGGCGLWSGSVVEHKSSMHKAPGFNTQHHTYIDRWMDG